MAAPLNAEGFPSRRRLRGSSLNSLAPSCVVQYYLAQDRCPDGEGSTGQTLAARMSAWSMRWSGSGVRWRLSGCSLRPDGPTELPSTSFGTTWVKEDILVCQCTVPCEVRKAPP